MNMSDPEKIAADISALRSDVGWIKDTLARREVACARHMERLDQVERDVAEAKGKWGLLAGLATGGGVVGAMATWIMKHL